MSEIAYLIARNVRRYRIERDMSLSELARRAGLAKQTLVSLETGKSNPTIDTLSLVAAGLGVSLRRLMTEWGTSLLVERSGEEGWRASELGRQRVLDDVYGSGYVRTWMLSMERSGATPAGPRRTENPGTLLHLYVVEGRVRTGPLSEPVELDVGDFARFPADAPYLMAPLSDRALLHIVSTIPQLRQIG